MSDDIMLKWAADKELQDEITRLRAELAAAWKEAEEQNESRCELLKTIGSLRAELAAERERADKVERAVKLAHRCLLSYDNVALGRIKELATERDKLRETLAQVRNATGVDERVAAFAAIDAVLAETGGRRG